MKTIILTLSIFLSITLFGKEKPGTTVPITLPLNLELNDELQTFKVTTTHFNGDIFGNFFNKQQVFGEYSRGLDDGKVKWNKVSVFKRWMDR